MARPNARILSVSYDQSLLRTREWILNAAGFHVTSAFGFTEAFTHCQNSAFDLAIIGHSIPTKDKLVLIHQLRKHTHTRVLSLRRGGEEALTGVDHSVEPSEGAESFIDAVRSLLDKKSSERETADA